MALENVPRDFVEMFLFFYPQIDVLEERDNKGNNLAHILVEEFYTVDASHHEFCICDNKQKHHYRRNFQSYRTKMSKAASDDDFIKEFTKLLQIKNDKGTTPMYEAMNCGE